MGPGSGRAGWAPGSLGGPLQWPELWAAPGCCPGPVWVINASAIVGPVMTVYPAQAAIRVIVLFRQNQISLPGGIYAAAFHGGVHTLRGVRAGGTLGAVPVLEVWELRVPPPPRQHPAGAPPPAGAYTTDLIAMETDTAPAKPKHLRAAGNFPREMQPGSQIPANWSPSARTRTQVGGVCRFPGALGGLPELSGDLAGW